MIEECKEGKTSRGKQWLQYMRQIMMDQGCNNSYKEIKRKASEKKKNGTIQSMNYLWILCTLDFPAITMISVITKHLYTDFC